MKLISTENIGDTETVFSWTEKEYKTHVPAFIGAWSARLGLGYCRKSEGEQEMDGEHLWKGFKLCACARVCVCVCEGKSLKC